MAGTHLTGPLVLEGAATVGSTLKTVGKVSSAGSFNIVPFAAVGSTASTITFTGSPGVASGLVFGAYVDVSAAS